MNGADASTGTGSRILDDLAEVIGEAAALDLAWAYKGEQFYVPKNPATDPRIAEAIGEEAAAKLCEVFWRTTIYMPFSLVLERKVQQLAAQGVKRKDIARRLHIAERRVYRLLEAKGDSAQLPLF